jgi:hypothetical protein
MFKKLAIIGMMTASTPALAEVWATADCTLANGGSVRYAVHNSKGFITYDNDGPYEMFTKRDGDMGIVTHIGNRGNTVLAVDLNSGRGYIITKFDDGRTREMNVICRLGSTQK